MMSTLPERSFAISPCPTAFMTLMMPNAVSTQSFTHPRFTATWLNDCEPTRGSGHWFSSLAFSLLFTGLIASTAAAEQAVQFDLPGTSAATLFASEPQQSVDIQPFTAVEKTVTIDFHLSTILAQLPAPQIEQLVVQIKPLGGSSLVADYSPRTEFSSRYATDIAVCESNESSDHVGLGIQGSYTDLARGNVGADKGHKQGQESKYAQVAPQHVIAASGTTHRGHGVYFKLRADARQVIDGDRTFTVSLRVPAGWRGELIEFRVQAEAMSRTSYSPFASLTGNTPKLEPLGTSRFLVAAYLDTDTEAAQAAKQLANTEQSLREVATHLIRQPRPAFAVPKDVYVAFRLDPKKSADGPSTEKTLQLIERVLYTDFDPYFDSQIKKLPVDVRVAILDYLDARERFDEACSER